MNDQLKTAESIFKEWAHYIGLDKSFTVRTYFEHSSMGMGLTFSKAIEYNPMISTVASFVDTNLKPIIDNIENSDAVKDMKSELTSEVKTLKELQLKLQEEIQRLKPFEEYYNLALKMNHGKDV
jgi:hypothetical protein